MLATDQIPKSEFSETVIKVADAWLAAVAPASSSHQERIEARHVPNVSTTPVPANSQKLNLVKKTLDDTHGVFRGNQNPRMTTRSASKVNTFMKMFPGIMF